VSNRVAVHFSPHPDDELLGAPAALFALRDAGWRIVNVACSLGRAEQEPRRLAELEEACRRARFELRRRHPDPATVLHELQPDLVIAPNPHDRHPFHEQVGRAVLAAVSGAEAPETVWLWSVWGELELPSLVLEVSEQRFAEIVHALSAHVGELGRNDHRRLLRARTSANAVLGAERVFGFGALALPFARAELLTELRLVDGRFMLCDPRVVREPDDPAETPAVPSSTDLTAWLAEPSLTTRFGARHANVRNT
jgi:LmbE family N-acetylglucosaminyl deacetylase